MHKFFIRSAAALALSVAAVGSFAAGSLAVSKQTTVDASPAEVWNYIGSFNGLKDWHPAVADSTLQGEDKKVGTTRTLTLKGGGTIHEKLDKYNGAKHSYTYEILESPLPVKNYKSTISVHSAGKGKSTMKWASHFDAKDAPNDKAKEAIAGVYEAGLKNVADHFKK